jgi:hypothetical protein
LDGIFVEIVEINEKFVEMLKIRIFNKLKNFMFTEEEMKVFFDLLNSEKNFTEDTYKKENITVANVDIHFRENVYTNNFCFSPALRNPLPTQTKDMSFLLTSGNSNEDKNKRNSIIFHRKIHSFHFISPNIEFNKLKNRHKNSRSCDLSPNFKEDDIKNIYGPLSSPIFKTNDIKSFYDPSPSPNENDIKSNIKTKLLTNNESGCGIYDYFGLYIVENFDGKDVERSRKVLDFIDKVLNCGDRCGNMFFILFVNFIYPIFFLFFFFFFPIG